MGIMNKMKTVAAWLLDWYKNNPGEFWAYFPTDTKPHGKVFCPQYENATGWGKDRTVFAGGNAFGITDNRYIDATVAEFKSAMQMQGVLLTYETIDSVEEEIVSYHPQQLVKDENTLIESGGITASFDKNTHRLQISGTATAYFSRSKHLVEVAELIPNHAYACVIDGVVSQGLFLNYKDTEKYAGLGTSSSIVWAGATTGAICYIGSNIYEGETANTDATIQIVDITAIYGAGNEPTPVENFLSQHPEYNSYVPFYDGEIHIAESIMNKMKTVALRDYNWGSNTGSMPSTSFYATTKVPGAKPYGIVHLSDDSVVNTSTYRQGIYIDDRPGIIIVMKQLYNTSAELKAALENIFLTYETVDSVEE